MAKKKPVDTNEHYDVPPMPARGREVVYSIVVPNCDDMVKIEHARRELIARQVPAHLIRVYPPVVDDDGKLITTGRVEVPRLFTIWQGDAEERLWQQSIQNALPSALIDVADWTPAPGYPQGEVGEATNGK